MSDDFHVNAPNYVGSKDELMRMVREGLAAGFARAEVATDREREAIVALIPSVRSVRVGRLTITWRRKSRPTKEGDS